MIENCAPENLAIAKERYDLGRNRKVVNKDHLHLPFSDKDPLKCVSTRNNDTKVRLSKSVLNGIAAVIPEKFNFPSCHWEDETRRSHA